MPRKLRVMHQGSFYHVLSRGNNRSTLFHEEDDFHRFLFLLHKYLEKHGVRLFHYCLMTNHVHLLMENVPEADGISKFMHDLQTAYAIYSQKKYEVTGHIFESRFKDFLIETDAYLLECGRYIERNPVRAGMVPAPGDYPWSSFTNYARGEGFSWITPNPLYSSLGKTKNEQQINYASYVSSARPYEKVTENFFDERLVGKR